MSNIFEKNKKTLLNKKIDLIRKDAHKHGRFSMFDISSAVIKFNSDAKYEDLKRVCDILEECDKRCNLPYDIGILLDKLATDYAVMVHKTQLFLNPGEPGLDNNENLLNIMRDGLKNYGHSNQGIQSETLPDLNLTMAPLKGIEGFINLLEPYKSNDAIVIGAFPKNLIDEDGNGIDYTEIYDLSSYPPKIKPEYIAGVILKKENGLDEFYTRDEVINRLSNSLSTK